MVARDNHENMRKFQTCYFAYCLLINNLNTYLKLKKMEMLQNHTVVSLVYSILDIVNITNLKQWFASKSII